MANYYYPEDGIKLGHYIQNSSSLYPIIRLHNNHASGLGFFTSVGQNDGTDDGPDTNVLNGTSEKFLRNLPVNKRVPGYIAIVNKVVSGEAPMGGGYVESNDPAIYIYKGGYTNQEFISNSDWRDPTNWTRVEGTTGSGTITLNVNSAQDSQNVATLDLIGTSDVTTVTGNNDGSATFNLATNLARNNQNFYIGDVGAQFLANSGDISGATSGVAVRADGRIQSVVDSVMTTINGKDITVGAGGEIDLNSGTLSLNTSGNITFGQGNTNITPTQINTSQINGTTISSSIIQGSGANGLRLSTSDTTMDYVKFQIGDDYTQDLTLSASAVGNDDEVDSTNADTLTLFQG